jgi:hypothetical protein
MATRAPSWPKRIAVARPMPSLPPVMATTFPFSPISTVPSAVGSEAIVTQDGQALLTTLQFAKLRQ